MPLSLQNRLYEYNCPKTIKVSCTFKLCRETSLGIAEIGATDDPTNRYRHIDLPLTLSFA